MTKSSSDMPLQKAEQAAIKALNSKREEATESAKPFLDQMMISSLIQIAAQSKFDDSPLVLKQKIRKLIKSRIRTEG